MAAETMRITEELIVEDKTGPGLTSAEQKVSAFDKTLQNTQSRLKNMSGSRWDMTVNAVDKATSIITKVEGKIHGAVGKAWNFTVGLIDKVTSPLQAVFNLLRNPLLQAGAVLGISISASDAIKTFGGFEATMSQVKAISGASADDMADLTALAKEMGATTKFTAEEAAQGLTYMAMAGWKTEDMLTSLSGVMNLAAASGEDLATVSDIVTDAMTAFGLSADGVTATGVSNAMHFSDVLAAASSNANTNVSIMGETFKYVGSMAGAMGYSIEDVALATGLMANSGIKGTMAGTALNSMLTRLSTNTSGAADALSALGVEFYNADGSARNLGDVMGELRKATAGMTAAQKSELANTVAGMEAQKGLLAILNTSEEDYNKLAEAIYNADGAAQQMSDTMLDNMQGSMTLLQSAVDGVKLSLGSRLSPYVRQFADWLTTKMPAVEETINEVMDTIDGKIASLKSTIEEFTSSEEWANADVWGKIGIAWDKIVAEPFSSWWESSGKPWLTEKVAGFGETLGSGITQGLLAILGFDASGAVEDGKTIGSSFIDGFKQGFDTDKIGEALTDWANDHKGLIAAAGVIAGGKLIGGIARAFQGGKNFVGEMRSLFGGGSTGGSGGLAGALKSFTTNTMTVTAGTVIVNGANVANAASAAKNIIQTATGTGGALALPGVGKALALPGPVAAGGAAAGGLTSAGSWLSKLLMIGSKSSVIGADGTLLAVQGGVGGTLGSIGGALGSTATTAAGAAAAGAAGTGGIIGGALGLISAGIDVFQGIGKSKEGDKKGAKDEYVTAGTKGGMVAAGAGVGAAIGSVVPGVGTAIGALVGAGVGGIGALLGGNKAGKAISDSTDEGGWLNTAGKEIGNFFTDTLPGFVTETIPETASTVGSAVGEFATKVGRSVGGFFTDTVPNFFTQTIPSTAQRAATAVGDFATKVGDKVGNFFTEDIPAFVTEKIPYAAGYVFGKAEIFFTETLPSKFGEIWGSVSTFFTETLPTWAQGIYERAATFFTETIPEFFGGLWDSVATFFTETIPTWAENVFNAALTFFTETVPTFFGGLWENVSTFMTETLPAWVEGVTEKANVFFTETVPAFFGGLWNDVSTFMTETLPTWADGVYQKAATFFGETVPEFFGTLWSDVTTFVTETIPTWASTAFEKVSTFFGETIPGFFGSMWDSVTGFVTETIPSWGSIIATKVSGWWSSVSGWFDNLWGTISGAFGAGRSAAKSKHAEGGIMYAPHTAQVAEDGPEAIIPLGGSDRPRGIAVWEQAGDILGVGSNDTGINPRPVGSNDDGTTETPPDGAGGGPDGAGGGDTAPVFVTTNTGGTGPQNAPQDSPITVPVSIALNPEIIIQGTEGMRPDDVVRILKERIRELVDDISDEMAERLARIFSNMPLKGGA